MQKNHQLLAWLILFFLGIIWGSSFILIKKSLLAFDHLQVGAGRITIAFLAFLPLLFTQIKKLRKEHLIPLLVVGLAGSGLPAFLYATAQTQVPSAIAGILNALTPIFAFIIGLLAFGRKFLFKHLIGIILGLSGTILIFISGSQLGGVFNYYYIGLIVLATILYGISANTVSKYLVTVNPILISTVSFAFIGPFALTYLLSTDFLSIIQTHPDGGTSILALSTLSLASTFGANIIFFRLIQMTDAVFSSSVSFIAPFIAVLWGFMDGEAILNEYVIALILILGGLFLIKKQNVRTDSINNEKVT